MRESRGQVIPKTKPSVLQRDNQGENPCRLSRYTVFTKFKKPATRSSDLAALEGAPGKHYTGAPLH
jgi:hypothetical protein